MVSILTPYLPAILLFGGSKLWQDTLAFEDQKTPNILNDCLIHFFLVIPENYPSIQDCKW